MKKFLLLILAVVLAGCSAQTYQAYTEIEQQNYSKMLYGYDMNPECRELAENIIGMLEESDYCTAGSDCKIVYLNCPFGCYNLVNKDVDTSELEALGEKFDKDCRMCIYDCLQPPASDKITCKDGKCGAIRTLYK